MKKTFVSAIFVSTLLLLAPAFAGGPALAAEMHGGANTPPGNNAPGNNNPPAIHNDDNSPPPGNTGCLSEKYRTVKKTIYAPGDRHKYGETYERGYRTTSTYGNTHNIPAGYWVYCAPYWYVYGEKSRTNQPPSSHPQDNHDNDHDNGPNTPPHNPPGH